jgi:arylsulfatase A-like enzyme
MSALATILPALAWSFTAPAQTSTNPPPLPRKPCVILIVADDLGIGELGCYGQTKIKTPNIDRLAAEGMRFTSYYAGSSLSSPSRAALMTGMDTGHGRIRGSEVVPLRAFDVTMAELLQQAHYRTAAVGKWGLGGAGTAGVPGLKGFEEWCGFLDEYQAQDYYPQFINRSGEGDDRYIQVSLNSNGKKGKYIDDYFTEEVMNFIKFSKPAEVNNFNGFFAYLPYTLPRVDVEYGPAPAVGLEIPGTDPYTDEPWPEPAKIRAAMITRVDYYVGQLMEKLAAEKTDKNTMIILTSATGPQKRTDLDPKFFNSTDSLRGFKHDLYEGALRVPLIVRWPLQIKPGTTSDLAAAHWDWVSTMAEIARVAAPKGVDGISLFPTLKGQAQTNRHEFLYWELHDHGFKQAVRMGDWKAVRLSADGPLELYNLKRDPSEQTDVANKNPEVVAKIEQYLKTARTDDPKWPVQKSDASASTPGGG